MLVAHSTMVRGIASRGLASHADPEPECDHGKQQDTPIGAFDSADDGAQFGITHLIAAFVTPDEAVADAESLVNAEDHQEKDEYELD